MSSAFAISTATNAVNLDGDKCGTVSFTVSNLMMRPLRGRALVKPLQDASPEWFNIGGEAERDFAADGTHEFRVQVTVSPEAAPGKKSFRFDVLMVDNPDDYYSEGPVVAFEVKPAPVRKSPWPLVVTLLMILAIAGAATWWLWPRGTGLVAVPNVIGQPSAAAIATLAKLNLIGQPNRLVVVPNLVAGAVADQDPKSGSLVKGSTVKLAVQGVAVPNVIGRRLGDATQVLQGVGLSPIVQYLFQQRVLDTVVATSPPPQAPVPAGSTVTLFVTRWF